MYYFIYKPPYKIIERYKKFDYRTRHIQSEIKTPSTSLKKTTYKLDLSSEQENLINAFFTLDILPDLDTVIFTKELRIGIDTSTPLDNLAVEKILTGIRITLSSIQADNKHAKYLLAENTEQLVKTSLIPEINRPNIEDLKELHKSQIPGTINSHRIKNLLCGLIILYRYKFSPEDTNTSLEKLYSNLSDELMLDIGLAESKFSVETIARGYKQVKKLFDNEVIML